ncbi:unnamed protein product [Rangifer tarandus platyrhynchus]|uniref:Uncharacterized protein n=1 Tax=Rangifer tarandus platyrhynchus TaxID=3082113 RepID=A0AC59YBB0_RANTA
MSWLLYDEFRGQVLASCDIITPKYTAPEYWLPTGSRASASADGAWFLLPVSLLGAVPPGWGHLDAWPALWLWLVWECG